MGARISVQRGFHVQMSKQVYAEIEQVVAENASASGGLKSPPARLDGFVVVHDEPRMRGNSVTDYASTGEPLESSRYN